MVGMLQQGLVVTWPFPLFSSSPQHQTTTSFWFVLFVLFLTLPGNRNSCRVFHFKRLSLDLVALDLLLTSPDLPIDALLCLLCFYLSSLLSFVFQEGRFGLSFAVNKRDGAEHEICVIRRDSGGYWRFNVTYWKFSELQKKMKRKNHAK